MSFVIILHLFDVSLSLFLCHVIVILHVFVVTLFTYRGFDINKPTTYYLDTLVDWCSWPIRLQEGPGSYLVTSLAPPLNVSPCVQNSN